MSELPKQLQVPPTVLWTEVGDDEVIIFDTGADNYFKLTEVGACLWRSWVADGSVASSIDAVIGDYDVPRETASSDAAELIEELSRRGLLRLVGA